MEEQAQQLSQLHEELLSLDHLNGDGLSQPVCFEDLLIVTGFVPIFHHVEVPAMWHESVLRHVPGMREMIATEHARAGYSIPAPLSNGSGHDEHWCPPYRVVIVLRDPAEGNARELTNLRAVREYLLEAFGTVEVVQIGSRNSTVQQANPFATAGVLLTVMGSHNWNVLWSPVHSGAHHIEVDMTSEAKKHMAFLRKPFNMHDYIVPTMSSGTPDYEADLESLRTILDAIKKELQVLLILHMHRKNSHFAYLVKLSGGFSMANLVSVPPPHLFQALAAGLLIT